MDMYGVVLTSEQRLDKKRGWARKLEHRAVARDVRSEGDRGKEWMSRLDQWACVLSLAGIHRHRRDAIGCGARGCFKPAFSRAAQEPVILACLDANETGISSPSCARPTEEAKGSSGWILGRPAESPPL